MNQLERFKILQSCEYLLEHLPSTQTNDIHNIWLRLGYKEDEELILPDFKKCTTCGGTFPISCFNSKLGESKDCEHCREYNLAIKGIKQTLRYMTEISEMFDPFDEYGHRTDGYYSMEVYIESIIDKIPNEFIELKMLIIKTQKKLQKL